MKKVALIITEDWYFWSHRKQLAISSIDAGHSVVLFSRNTGLRKDIEALGISFVDLDSQRSSIGILGSLSYFVSLYKAIKKYNPDVIHNVAQKPILFGTIAGLLLRVNTIICAFAGMGYVFTDNSKKALVLRRFLTVAYKFLFSSKRVQVIVQNQDDSGLAENTFSVPKSRLHLIRGSGVDVDYFFQQKFPDKPIVITLVARMLLDKGVNEFYEAAKIIKKDYQGVEFRLVGDIDPYNPSSLSKEEITEWAAEGVVIWNGFVKDIRACWQNSHIAVLPSYREGLPKSLLEAAASGRPIVCTDAPGCRELVEDGVNGFLVPPKNSLALSEAIKRLLKSDELQEDMGAASRKLAVEEFSLSVINNQVMQLYG